MTWLELYPACGKEQTTLTAWGQFGTMLGNYTMRRGVGLTSCTHNSPEACFCSGAATRLPCWEGGWDIHLRTSKGGIRVSEAGLSTGSQPQLFPLEIPLGQINGHHGLQEAALAWSTYFSSSPVSGAGD